jgi:hypothetical protein
MMGFPMYPERELWYSPSFFKTDPAAAVTATGSWMDTRDFMGNVGSFAVFVPPGITTPVTIAFETADGDPAQGHCKPLNVLSRMNQGGLCDQVTQLEVTADPAHPEYSATRGQTCVVPLQCRKQFTRPVQTQAVPIDGVVVVMIGKARQLYST